LRRIGYQVGYWEIQAKKVRKKIRKNYFYLFYLIYFIYFLFILNKKIIFKYLTKVKIWRTTTYHTPTSPVIAQTIAKFLPP